MRHLKHTAKLGRNNGHRKAMLVNLACSLIEHDQIETTVTRAKELRRFVERLVTTARKGGDYQKRLVYARLKINTPTDKEQGKKAVLERLFNEVAPRYVSRPGGYTRIVRTSNRVGDGAPMCLIQFVEAAAVAEKAEEAKAE